MSTKASYSKRKPSGVRGHWADEIRADAGRAVPHRPGRRTEKQRWMTEARGILAGAL